jgi:hypothetical protein
MRADRGDGWVWRPVRPVGAPASRYCEGLTAASWRNVRLMVGRVNGLSREFNVAVEEMMRSRDSMSWRL